MIKNIRHTGIVVKDLKQSLKFYRDLLGFETVIEMNESGDYIDTLLSLQNAAVKTLKLKSPCGQMIELLHFLEPASRSHDTGINDTGITHIAVTVDNADSVYEKLSREKVPCLSSPCVSPDGNAKVVFCKTPEGAFLELVEILREM